MTRPMQLRSCQNIGKITVKYVTFNILRYSHLFLGGRYCSRGSAGDESERLIATDEGFATISVTEPLL